MDHAVTMMLPHHIHSLNTPMHFLNSKRNHSHDSLPSISATPNMTGNNLLDPSIIIAVIKTVGYFPDKRVASMPHTGRMY